MILVGVVVLLWLNGQARAQVGVYKDDAAYVVLAESLIQSDRYGLANTPGAPGATQFPFAYPLLLSIIMRVLPGNFTALKALSLGATLLNVSLVFWGWRWLVGQRSAWWGWGVAALYALTPLTLVHSTLIMAEPVFLTACLVAILVTERVARTDPPLRWLWYAALSLALVLVVFTRTVGVVLLVAIFAYLLIRRGIGAWKPICLIVVQMGLLVGGVVAATPVRWMDLIPSRYLTSSDAALLVAPLIDGTAREAGHVVGEATGNDAGLPADSTTRRSSLRKTLVDYVLVDGVRRHLLEDLRRTALALGGGKREQSVAWGIGVPTLPAMLDVLVVALVIVGYVRGFTRGGVSLFLLASVLYFASLFLWVWAGLRLLYPIQPQIQFGLLLGAESALLGLKALLFPHWARQRAVNLPLACVAALLIVAYAVKGLWLPETRTHVGDLRVRTSWLTEHSLPSDIVMTEEPVADYIYLGRKTVPVPDEAAAAARILDYISKNRVAYVLIAPTIQWQDEAKPAYSAQANDLNRSIQTLEAQGRVALVYASAPDAVQVYRVQS